MPHFNWLLRFLHRGMQSETLLQWWLLDFVVWYTADTPHLITALTFSKYILLICWVIFGVTPVRKWSRIKYIASKSTHFTYVFLYSKRFAWNELSYITSNLPQTNLSLWLCADWITHVGFTNLKKDKKKKKLEGELYNWDLLSLDWIIRKLGAGRSFTS